jgi:hypothetical protein
VVTIGEVALFADGGALILGDRRQVQGPGGSGFATVVNAGSGAVTVGNDTGLGNLWSVGPITMEDRVHVRGFVRTSSTLTRNPQTTTIDDLPRTATGLPSLPLQQVLAAVTFSVTFPAPIKDVIIPADGPLTKLAPGSYGTVSVGDRATLQLQAGFYFFNTFSGTAQANLALDTSGGIIEVYVKTSIAYQCRQTSVAGSLNLFRLIYTGTTAVTLDVSPSNTTSFTGIVLAMSAQLNLDQEITYNGAFFAQGLNVQPSTNVVLVPWDGVLHAPQVTRPPQVQRLARRGAPSAGIVARAVVVNDADHFTVTFAAPTEVNLEDIALLADSGELQVGSGAKLLDAITGFATVVSSGSGGTSVDTLTDVGDIWSVGDVGLGNGTHVHGQVHTSGAINADASAIIDVPSTPVSNIPLSTALSLDIIFPQNPATGPTVVSGTTPLPPGGYQVGTVSGGVLELSTGTYYFDELHVTGAGVLSIRANKGPVEINVRTTLQFTGTLEIAAGNASQLRIVYLGTTTLSLTGPFPGNVIAGRAGLVLNPSGTVGTDDFVGAFFGQSVTVADGTVVRQQAFFQAPVPAVQHYVFGFSGPVGAGPYTRTLPAPPPVTDDEFTGGGPIAKNPNDTLGDLKPIVTITDSMTYQLSIVREKPISNTILQSDEGARPYVQLTGDAGDAANLAPTAGPAGSPGATFNVDGLWLAAANDIVDTVGNPLVADFVIEGSAATAQGDFDWDTVTIRHTTFDPGGRRADGSAISPLRLLITGRIRRLIIARSIMGPIEVQPAVGTTPGGFVEQIAIVDSIIDAGVAPPGPDGQVAIRSIDGQVVMRGVTVFGDIHADLLDATDSLVMGQLIVANTQNSCFRFSAASPSNAFPPEAPPKQFQSVFEQIEPFFFTSLRFGDPGYAQLSRIVPDAIRRGAENTSEMGAFSFLLNPIRLVSVQAKIDEFGPTGVLFQYIFEGETATGVAPAQIGTGTGQ